VPSSSDEPPEQQVPQPDEATAALPHASDRAALVNRLQTFAENAKMGMRGDIRSWVASVFSGDWAAVAAAAEGGDAEAQHVMALAPRISDEERSDWIDRAMVQGNLDAHLHFGVNIVAVAGSLQLGGVSQLGSYTDQAMRLLKLPAESGSATAQFVKAMLLYIFDCDSESQADFLDAARWICMAAKQKVAEAQYELGEMFRPGLFCDVNMRFARKHVRRASRQGHAEAVERMRERRSCAFCGADDAPKACALCRKLRYCDNDACYITHWREGGGVGGGGISGGGASGARHKDVCPRTHAAADESDDGESDDQEEEEEEGLG
jgi:hypothetical protein